VQSCHAVADSARFFIPIDLEHPHFVVCGVKNEDALQKALQQIQVQGVRCRAFLEADIGDQMTAIATEPVYGEQRRLFKKFRLFKPATTQKEAL
jgi:hypothetical protein